MISEYRDHDGDLVDWRQRRMAEEDLDSSMCIEAGAGTGKTRLLVNRYLNLLREGKAECREIVAITFTEKAAAEMKERLRKEISAIVRKNKKTAESGGSIGKGGSESYGDLCSFGKRMERALIELERAPISTIHSFASSLIRDYPVEAGVNPGFEQMAEPDITVFFDDCWSEFLEETSGPHVRYIQRYMRLGGRIDKLKELAAAFYNSRFEREVTGRLDGEAEYVSAGKEQKEDSGIPEGSREDRTSSLLDAISDYARKLMESASRYCQDSEDNGYLEIMDFIGRFGSHENLKDEELEEFLLFLDPPGAKGAKKNWNPPEKCSEYKESAGELKTLLNEYRSGYLQDVIEGVTGWLEDYLQFVARRKNEKGVLDFDDLLIEARKLLNNQEVLESARKRYRYILVDEFQDTDPIQAEIIFVLAGIGPEGAISMRERSSSLFIVGDPKQSIYRFRKADIEVYERVKKLFSAQGALHGITQNFRSGRKIVEWVNRAFSRLIESPEEGAYQPDYEPIFPHRSDDNASVVVLDLEEDFGKSRADEMRKVEGKGIARLIKNLIQEKRLVRDVDSKLFRPLKYSDIALIYRGSTGLENYEDPLRSEGIPYLVEGGGLYYSRQEVRDLATALWSIEDPGDSVAVFAALRSSLFGFSDEEIFMFKESGGSLDYLAGPVPEGKRYGPFAKAFELLCDLHRRRNQKGSSWTVRRLVAGTSLMEVSLFRPHGRQRVANIRKAVQTARAFDSSLYSFRQFAEFFMERAAGTAGAGGMFGGKEPESSLVDEEENAVRLLSVHKSKGLQFPVVIMANLLQSRIYRGGVYIEGGRKVELRLRKGWETPGYGKASQRDKQREEAENIRLMYVAATRAGDLLVIPRVPKRNSFYELIEDYLPAFRSARESDEERSRPIIREEESRADDGREVRDVVSVVNVSTLSPLSPEEKPYSRTPDTSVESLSRRDAVRGGWIKDRERLIEKSAACPLVVTPSGAEDAVFQQSAAEEKGSAGSGVRAAAPGVESTLEAKGALSFGSAFHRLMESVDFSSPGEIGLRARKIALEYSIPEAAEELAGLAARTLESDIMKRALVSTSVFREVPFTIRWNRTESQRPASLYISGRVDLLFEERGKWTAVDYKTDRVEDPGSRLESYRMQGALYITALERAGIHLDKGIVFYFARPGVPVLLKKEDVAGKEVEEFLAGVGYR